MSENKRYYWLKLKEDFMEDDAIQWLEEQENGQKYAYFYLKLCLKSLRTDGTLIRTVGNMLIPYDQKALSKLTNTDPDTVIVAMELLKKIGLIQVLDTGQIYLNRIDEMVGSETNKAELMRRKRELDRIGNNVTQELPNCYTEYRDIEIRDKEKDIVENKEKDNKENEEQKNKDIVRKPDNVPYEEVIEYLNMSTNSNYKHSTKKTKDLIKARFNEGFLVDDFKQVIDIKTIEWINTENEKYLRPETLFGTKFEGYLNQKGVNVKNKSKMAASIAIDDL